MTPCKRVPEVEVSFEGRMANRPICILGGPPHPVIVTIMDNMDCIRVLLYSYYTTITG